MNATTIKGSLAGIALFGSTLMGCDPGEQESQRSEDLGTASGETSIDAPQPDWS